MNATKAFLLGTVGEAGAAGCGADMCASISMAAA
jgi:hypothetical protein